MTRKHRSLAGSRPSAASGRTVSLGSVALMASLCAVALGAQGILEIDVLDATVSEIVERPDATHPGPILHDASDGLTFSSGLTDLAAVWYAELTSVTNNTSATQATIQGNLETFSDWFYGKQNSASKYASFSTTGTYDSDAASYTVPLLFTKSSQGTLTTRSYDATTPTDGGTVVTYYWAYDADANRYVFGTGKDLAAATQVAPIAATLGTTYTTTMETNQYVVTSVGSAPDYLPTLKQGKHLALLDLPASHTWYLLMDTPPGVHEDTYGYELQVTAQSV